MKRIYFLLPDVDTAHNLVDALLLQRIEARHIHVIAREGTPMEELPEASFVQTSDFVPGMERGLAAGGATGLVAGLVAASFPPAGLVIGGGALLAIAVAGAGFGALWASLVGAALPNSRLKQFQQAIENGEVLMMVDVPYARADEIEALVREHHPEVEIEGREPTVPPFP
ncbi:MAG TPA: DUF1269 domain-containing protein [Gammaproteobacteria bacterium]|nr:DUF1269 domain-containing protein [Gammaproteobacteria bacterium]